jgi:hypothetical protein
MAPVAAAAAAVAKTSSYYGSSWSVLCEDDTSDTGNKVVVLPPLCSPLLFYLNLLNSSVADEMDWHCDMMLHL